MDQKAIRVPWVFPAFLASMEFRATLDSQDPEAHLAWMAVMELKELLDFQALMAILGFLDYLGFLVRKALKVNLPLPKVVSKE